jgi:hypothetical protein
LVGESKKIRDVIEHWMTLDEPRGGAEGYAEADLWRNLNSGGKLSELDVGFVIALESVAHKLAYLEWRIGQLESRLG